jgi:integrase/recombinase XerD
MTSPAAPSFAHYVQCFFSDYLTVQRSLSPNTVLSYRDTFKLFLNFTARRSQVPVANIGFAHVGTDTVLAFLEDLEKSRKCTVRTRNARLAALHSFFRYVATREPQVLDLCQRISAIPVKRTKYSPAGYLEYDEVKHILGSIDCSTDRGKRDHLLIQLLFETGLRAQEAASLKTSSLRLSKPFQLRVLGKGRRERVCPLRADTASRLGRSIKERGLSSEHFTRINRKWSPRTNRR